MTTNQTKPTAETTTFKAIEFNSASEAIQWTFASRRGEAVLLNSQHYVIEHDEAERLAAAGIELSYLYDHEMANGEHRIIGVPVNEN